MKRERKPMSVAILCQVLEDARNISSCSSGKPMVRSQQTLLTEKVFRPRPTMSAQLCPYLHPYVQVSPTILTCYGFAHHSSLWAFMWCLNLPFWINDHQLNIVEHVKPAVLPQCNDATMWAPLADLEWPVVADKCWLADYCCFCQPSEIRFDRLKYVEIST